MTPRYWIGTILLGALLWAGYQKGIILPLFETDRTYITSIIATLFLAGLLLLGGRQYEWVRRIEDTLPALGLFGTFVGLAITFNGVAGETNIELRDLGVATALNTTIVGIAGSIWLSWQRRLA